MTTTTPSPTPSPSAASRRRVLGLARANALLMTRNRLTLVYGLVVPLLPLLLLLAGERGNTSVGGSAVTTTLLMAFLFPVYYNVLSLVVSRRDELVLKRLRTGETRDSELIVALAAPGVVVALVVAVLTLGVGLAAGLPVPVNLPLYVVGVLVAAVMFVAFAFWTAAWTRTAEAAQMTSLPVMTLALVGTFSAVMPPRLADVAASTPGGALDRLVRISWFGEDGSRSVGFLDGWVAAGAPLLALLAWTALAVWLAARSLQWEPRS